MLPDHKPNPALPQQISDAETRLAETINRKQTYAGAVTRQQQTVGALEDAVANERKHAFAAEVAGPQKELHEAVERLVAASVEVMSLTMKYGQQDSFTPFPPHDSRDLVYRSTERQLQLDLLNKALALASYRQRSRGTMAA